MTLLLVSSQAYILKNLIDIVYHNSKDDVCFELTENGLFCEQISPNNERMLQFTLYENTFNKYVLSHPFVMGLQLRQLINIFKSVRKNDTLQLETLPENKQLKITIFNIEQRREISNIIPYFDIQQIKPEAIVGYSKFISISVLEFSKLVKEIYNLNSDILLQIFYTEKTLRIISRGCEISEKIVTIGSTPEGPPDYESKFSYNFFNSLSRLNFITHQIRIYFDPTLPLYLMCNLNDRGKLNYYINSTNDKTDLVWKFLM